MYRVGLADFTSPSCVPGSDGCVPHWYCYIPGLVSPDCWKSFVKGTGELVSTTTGAVGEAAGTAVRSVVEGTAAGFTRAFTPDSSSDGTNWGLWIGLGLVGVFALTTLAHGGPRRYGR